jgi:hypothetical protein
MASVEALSGPKPRRSRDDNRHSFQAAITAGMTQLTNTISESVEKVRSSVVPQEK